MVEVIESRQNKQLKAWRKLMSAKGRRQAGAYIIEGTHLVSEALQFQVTIQHLIMTQTYFAEMAQALPSYAGIPLVIIADHLSDDLAQTASNQGVFAEISIAKPLATPDYSGALYLLIDDVQDPGNLGTMIRTADACGAAGVVLGTGTVDLYNDKVQRAAQGSQWHLPIWQANLSETIKDLQAAQVNVLASALNPKAQALQEVVNQQRVAVIVGNEGAGVNPQLIDLADQQVFIPMPGQAESLNVAVAAAILMYHFVV